jgi:hypothetical protein
MAIPEKVLNIFKLGEVEASLGQINDEKGNNCILMLI